MILIENDLAREWGELIFATSILLLMAFPSWLFVICCGPFRKGFFFCTEKFPKRLSMFWKDLGENSYYRRCHEGVLTLKSFWNVLIGFQKCWAEAFSMFCSYDRSIPCFYILAVFTKDYLQWKFFRMFCRFSKVLSGNFLHVLFLSQIYFMFGHIVT